MVWSVGNATQAALFFQAVYGMELMAYSGPETGNRDHHAFVLRSGAVRFVVKGGVDPSSALLDHHRRHGDGVVDIALEVPDVDRCVAQARRQGAAVVEEPHDLTDEHGTVRVGRHRDVRRHPAHARRPLPLHRPLPAGLRRAPIGLRPARGRAARLFQALDHVVGNVELGRMDEWVDYYHRVMGFTNMAEFVGDDIATEYSALMSKVVASGNHRVKFPLNEPAVGKKRSQIDEFLDFYVGPGAQHLALATNDILTAVDTLRGRGVEFLDDPGVLLHRPAAAGPDRRGPRADRGVAARGILVDRDDDGYLLQIFTKPVGDRPTVFFELIERHGSLGFGKGTFFLALYRLRSW